MRKHKLITRSNKITGLRCAIAEENGQKVLFGFTKLRKMKMGKLVVKTNGCARIATADSYIGLWRKIKGLARISPATSV